MAVPLVVNDYEADLTADITQGAVAPFNVSVATVSNLLGVPLPTVGEFFGMIGQEIFRFSRNGSNLTAVARAQEGSQAAVHSSGAKVRSMLSTDAWPPEHRLAASEDVSAQVAANSAAIATKAPIVHPHAYAELTSPPDLSPLPTPGQKNALAGSQGTPGAGNEFLTKQDPSRTDARAPLAHTHPQSEVTSLVADLAAKQASSQKGQPNGYASLDGAGLVPASQLPASGGVSWAAVLVQAADATQATAAFNVTNGPVFNFAANSTYIVELFLLMRSSLGTAGFRLALDTSVAVTAVGLTFRHVLANTGTITAGQSRADATATGVSSGVDTVNADVPVIGSGILVSGANAGTARLVFGPEVAATATLRQGSVMRVHKAA